MRTMENEFVDFRNYKVLNQFKEIYGELFHAYKRHDKFVLTKHLSVPM